jgi:hypothetical protein
MTRVTASFQHMIVLRHIATMNTPPAGSHRKIGVDIRQVSDYLRGVIYISGL